MCPQRQELETQEGPSLRGPEGARPWDALLLGFWPPDQENSFLLS